MKTQIMCGTLAALCLVGGNALVSSADTPTPRIVTQSIVFDGFCDGLTYSVDRKPGPSTNTKVVYGANTGCVNATVGGAQATLLGQAGSIIVSGPYQGFEGTDINVTLHIFPNGTFKAFQVTPTSYTLVNTGTWSVGTPRLSTKNAPKAGGGSR